MRRIFSFICTFVLIGTIYFNTGLSTAHASQWLTQYPVWINEGQSITDYLVEWWSYPVRQYGDWFGGGRPAETPYYNTVNNVSNSGNTSYNMANSGNTSSTNNTINYNGDVNMYQYTFNNQTYNIENIYYNQEHNVYNIETTNNQNYYITYAPTYTNITYIDGGGTLQTTNYYYQLPDGRNSYDLTADEVFGTYFNYNVGLYDEVIEDTNTLGLFHFDGNLSNSAATNSSMGFTLNASSTYNQHDGFGSALYFPSTKKSTVQLYGAALSSSVDEFMIYIGGVQGTWAPTTSNKSLGNQTTFPNFVSHVIGTPRSNSFVYSQISTSNTANYTDINYAFYELIGFLYYRNGVGYFPIITTGSFTIRYSYTGVVNSTFQNLTISVLNIQNIKTGICFNKPSSPTINGYNCDFVSAGNWQYLLVSLGTGNTYHNGIRAQYPILSTFSSYPVNPLQNGFYIPAEFNFYILIDELRCSATTPYTSGVITLSHMPFDTNKVFVLPAMGSDGDIVVQSSIPVTDNRIGGVRPSAPTIGTVYIAIDKTSTQDNVTSVQQYQSTGWVTVQGSIYENGQWKQLNNYDMRQYTLNPDDFPDNSDGGGGSNSGGGGGSGDSGNSLLDSILGLIGDVFGFLGRIIGGIIDGIRTLLGSIIGLFEDVILFIGNFGDFLAGAFVFIPAEIITLLILGLSLRILLMVIKALRG